MEIRLKWNLQNQKHECVKDINDVRKSMYIHKAHRIGDFQLFFVDKTC